MSEIPRTYIPGRPGSGPRRRVRRRSVIRRGGGITASVLLLVALLLGVWALWTTRDTYSMAALIPDNQKYGIFFGRFLQERHTVADSPVWALAPADSLAAELPELLRNDFGLPEWAINHLVYGPCYVSGRDVTEFDDVLFVTKMSRIGCLTERFHGFYGVESDHAGGLRLRYLPEMETYYAVRGRVLVVSPSRDAVIRAVTLEEETAMPEGDLERGLGESRGADIYGHFTLGEGDPAGDVFETVRVLLRFEEDGMRAALTGRLAAPWEARLAGVLGGATPAPLEVPPTGMLQLSANFGISVKDVLRGIARAVEMEARFDEVWAAWTNPTFEAAPGVGPLIALAAEQAGPGIRLTWQDTDLHEMVPMPIVAGTADARDGITQAFAALPSLPEAAAPWEAWPRFDAETGVAYVPMAGGPSLQPTAALAGDTVVFSTSHPVAVTLLEEGVPTETVQEEGNLFVRIFPGPVVDAVTEVGMLLAENGMLAGHTPATFERQALAWKETATKVAEASGIAAHQNGEISMSLRLVMAPSVATAR